MQAKSLKTNKGEVMPTPRSKEPEKVRAIKRFSEYQSIVEQTDEKKQRMVSLLGLVGEVGDLHAMIKKLLLQKDSATFRAEMREEFGDLLWYLTSLASLYRIPLEEIAQENAKKATSLYLEGSLPRFDAGYPPDERLPRRFRVTFSEQPIQRGVRVKIIVNDVAVGDALTDNAREDDGYRFHDVFHFAYAAVLGWSPVVRALLRRKRKSRSKVDEVEDGGRAAIVEEAISIFVFNQAEERAWYQDASSIDIGLLKTVRRLAGELEVKHCTAKQWRRAIHTGYEAFAQLRKHNGGDVEVDLDKQRLAFISAPVN
jgi:NTP pyrophosphatase (non-canonical NTP hydrolase)